MKPLVSVVIPCYNVEAYIEEAIASVLSQTYPNLELICVDNMSTDATLTILTDLSTKHGFTLLSESKKGAPAARNTGLKASKGEWLQFLDGDDKLLPNKIEHQVSLATKNCPFIASRTMKVDLSTAKEIDWEVHENPWKGLLENRLGITTANLFNRDFLEQVGGWDEELKSSQEYDLMFRMMQENDQVIVDNSGPYSCIQSRSEGSISSDARRDNQHRFLRLMSSITAYLKEERKAEYKNLEDGFFQNMYTRIRLNTIDGYSDSSLFISQVLPDGFQVKDDRYDPRWYTILRKVFGIKLANGFQSLFR